MGVEARRLLERADVKLVRVFESDFGFVGNRFARGDPPVNE
jgi:hypothetical protein